jgi:ParB-like chromosome segregation protein Spo0J
MLEARPIVVNPEGIIIGGNMRYKACKAAGLTEAPVYVASWEESKANAFIIKDNVGYGEWDWDILANEWDAAELEEWGLDVWQPSNEEPSETDLSNKIEEMYRVEVVCTSEEEQEAAYNQITNLGYECRLLTL